MFSAISAMEVKTCKEELFVLVNDEDNQINIFSCFSNMKSLCSVETLYMDGTFEYCVNHFTQFFTIHGFKNGQYVPLVFCLLPNKLKTTYNTLFNIIIEKCREKGLHWSPTTIVIDFEVAIHKAV